MEHNQLILSAKDVNIQFNLRGKVLHAIRGIDLDLYQGEVLAIVGESGSGKSVFKTVSCHIVWLIDISQLVGFIHNNQIPRYTAKFGILSSGKIIRTDDDFVGDIKRIAFSIFLGFIKSRSLHDDRINIKFITQFSSPLHTKGSWNY